MADETSTKIDLDNQESHENSPGKEKLVKNRKMKFECGQCGEKFHRKVLLNRHVKSHQEKKSFECKECGKHLDWKRSLERHMRIHTGEKPFP